MAPVSVLTDKPASDVRFELEQLTVKLTRDLPMSGCCGGCYGLCSGACCDCVAELPGL
jgi:hypothetical protein